MSSAGPAKSPSVPHFFIGTPRSSESPAIAASPTPGVVPTTTNVGPPLHEHCDEYHRGHYDRTTLLNINAWMNLLRFPLVIDGAWPDVPRTLDDLIVSRLASSDTPVFVGISSVEHLRRPSLAAVHSRGLFQRIETGHSNYRPDTFLSRSLWVLMKITIWHWQSYRNARM